AINNTVRQLAGAIGTAVIMTIYTIQLVNVSLESNTAYINAASNTYFYMFVISIIAFIITWFTPKKTS
ncbi:MAG: MFS transporter, partial [Psychrobacillus psychrotolerans]